MWKWIGGGCLVIILIVCGVMYYAYRKVSQIAATPPAVVSIGATPARVFASLANGDSLTTWQMGPNRGSARHGMLVAGDTIGQMTEQGQSGRIAWVVDTVVPNTLIVSRAVMVDQRMPMFIRRDSLVAVGDSTQIVTTVSAAPALPGAPGGGMLNAVKNMGVAGVKTVTEQEMKNLKARIEGHPMVRPDSR